MTKQFAPIDRDEKVTLTKGDILNITALLTSGGDAIGTICDMMDQEGAEGSKAGRRLAAGSFGYVVKLFKDVFGVAVEDADAFVMFVTQEEMKRAKAEGVDMSQFEVPASSRNSMH